MILNKNHFFIMKMYMDYKKEYDKNKILYLQYPHKKNLLTFYWDMIKKESLKHRII